MPLRRRAFLSALVSVAGALGILYWAGSELMLASWRRIENQRAAQDVLRVVDAVTNDLGALGNVVSDYADWDDAYRFMADHNQRFVSSSLAEAAFSNLKVHQILFVDNQGRTVFRRGLDNETASDLTLPAALAALARALPNRAGTGAEPGLAGLVMLPDCPALVVAKPVHNSEGEGPRRGFVLMARYLNHTHLERLAKVTRLPFQLVPVAGASAQWQSVVTYLNRTGEPLTLPVSDHLLRAYALVNDLGGRPAVIATVDLDRPVYAEAQRTVGLGARFLIALGLVLVLVMVALLDTMVLGRFRRLRAELRGLDLSEGSMPRVRCAGDDELGEVAAVVNEMVDELVRFRERSREAEEQAVRAKAATLAAVSGFYLALDGDGHVTEWTQATEDVLGVSLAGAAGHTWCELPLGWDTEQVGQAISLCRQDGRHVVLEDLPVRRPDGREAYLRLTVALVPDYEAPVLVLLGTDVTEHYLLTRQLAQSQKLESIGQLAAGTAHEINTPTQFVGDNVRYLGDVFEEVEPMLRLCGEMKQHGDLSDQLRERLAAAVTPVDFDELLSDVPAALAETLDGVRRIAQIVLAMKEFSHPGETDMVPLDLNHAVENTLTVARNEWKYVADVTCDLQPNLPSVSCMAGELSQVLLNLIVNAAHAIGEKHQGSGLKGTITISTRTVEEAVEIRVADTGTGIPDALRERIFDPFYTTKEVGKGTGQGLALARAVVVDRHHGTLTCESQPGQGTTFIIRLPLALLPAGESDWHE